MKQQKIIYQTQPTKIVFGLFFRSIIKSGVSKFFSGKKRELLIIAPQSLQCDAALYFSVLLFYCSTKLQFAKISFTQECFPKRGACHLQILATGCFALSLASSTFLQQFKLNLECKLSPFEKISTVLLSAMQYKNENILEIA